MTADQIFKGGVYKTIDELRTELLNDKFYHERLYTLRKYKLFGDIDGYDKPISNFIEIYIKFLKEGYDLDVKVEDVYYTENKGKKGSYHYVIPKYHAYCRDLKDIHKNFLKEYGKEFTKIEIGKDDKSIIKSIIDTKVYADHWFRLPNQTKPNEMNRTAIHKIVVGTDVTDFVLEYIPKHSIDISKIPYLKDKVIIANQKAEARTTRTKKERDYVQTKNEDNDARLYINQSKDVKRLIRHIEWPKLYRIFNTCFDPCRYKVHEHWIPVGMAIYNKYGDDGFQLFKYFSELSDKPDTEEDLRYTYDSFGKNPVDKPITLGTLFKMAKDDNPIVYEKIITECSLKETLAVNSNNIAKMIHILKKDVFLWKNKYYCYNGVYWEEDTSIFKRYIVEGFYDIMRDLIFYCYFGAKKKTLYHSKIDKLQKLNTETFKAEIMSAAKMYFTNKDIVFDNRWDLFAFKDRIYSLKLHKFIQPKFNQYISMTTRYDWRTPTKEEIKTVEDMITSIFPSQDEGDLFKTILATGLEGRTLEHFIILNGRGGNGKSLIDDFFLLALGDYGYIASNAILFETTKTGSNPEKSNMENKRYIVFKEPSSNRKFDNNIIKELTGGNKFSARGHQESETERRLAATIVVECNNRPLFNSPPNAAEERRVVDILFKCRFTLDDSKVDKINHVYKANLGYKDQEFQDCHKFALMLIVFNAHKLYETNGYKLDIPTSITKRTDEYLKMSDTLLSWVNDVYEETPNKKDIIKLKDMFQELKKSEYYYNLSNVEKAKYNTFQSFKEQIRSSKLSDKYVARCNKFANYITNYIEKKDVDNE
jgi:phage/plasmid-associated DNA primase